MEPIKININVQIGVTEELYGLLSAFTKHVQAPAVAAAPAAEPAPATAPAAAAEVPEPAPQAEEAPAAEPAPVAEPEPQPEQEREFTEVDVRAAMDKTRRRIEGEDYKDNTTSELYKKYHRQLTAQFKNIAAALGSDKPSTLPSSELRGAFIRMCDELVIGEDGNIQTDKAPF